MMTVQYNQTPPPKAKKQNRREIIATLCDKAQENRAQLLKTIIRLANGGNLESNLEKAFYFLDEIKWQITLIQQENDK